MPHRRRPRCQGNRQARSRDAVEHLVDVIPATAKSLHPYPGRPSPSISCTTGMAKSRTGLVCGLICTSPSETIRRSRPPTANIAIVALVATYAGATATMIEPDQLSKILISCCPTATTRRSTIHPAHSLPRAVRRPCGQRGPPRRLHRHGPNAGAAHSLTGMSVTGVGARSRTCWRQ